MLGLGLPEVNFIGIGYKNDVSITDFDTFRLGRGIEFQMIALCCDDEATCMTWIDIHVL